MTEKLSEADVLKIIEADNAETERTDDVRRAARLSGLRCSCCDEPLPTGNIGSECAECADIEI